MSFAGTMPTHMIDLNMLRGDKIRTRRWTAPDSQGNRYFNAQTQVDDVIEVIDEDGERYHAIVEEADGKRLCLRLLNAPWMVTE